MDLHKAAAEGFQKSANVYEKGRPDYPDAAVDFLVKTLSLTPQTRIVDLGAGTGKLSRALVRRNIPLWAVEPVEGMRHTFSELLPQVPITEGMAESIPVDNATVDAVIVAQAFHWFDGKAALKEIARVLKPTGKLGLLWNVRDETIPWVQKLTAIMAPYEKNVPRYYTGEWKTAFRETTLFTPLQETHFPHVQEGNVETIVDRIASVSFIASLPDSELVLVKTRVRDVLAELENSDVIRFPYRTEVFWCEKTLC